MRDDSANRRGAEAQRLLESFASQRLCDSTQASAGGMTVEELRGLLDTPWELLDAADLDLVRSALKMLRDGGGLREVIELEANVRLELRDANGVLRDVREVHNLICTAGKNTVLKASSAEYLNQYSYIAIGTGTNAPAIGDTTLQTEIARANSTVSNPLSTQLQFQYTFPAGTGTGAITESGLLDAASTGNLLAHQTFSVVNKGASDTLQVTWQLT